MTEWQKYQRNLTTAKREIRKAVERWQDAEHKGVPPRRGHRVEALRQIRSILDETDALLIELSDAPLGL